MPVVVSGLRETVRQLEALGVDVADLKDAFAAIALEGSVVAQRLAPRRSGRLAGSIRGNRAKGKAVVTAGRATVPYAGPINYGWRRRSIAPSRFLERADSILEDRAPAILEEALNKAIQSRGLT